MFYPKTSHTFVDAKIDNICANIFIITIFEYDNSIHHEKNLVHIAHLQPPLRGCNKDEGFDVQQHPLAQGTWEEINFIADIDIPLNIEGGAACNNRYYINNYTYAPNNHPEALPTWDSTFNKFYCFFYRNIQHPGQELPTWIDAVPFPGRAREGAMLFAAGNKLYFGLGEHRRLSHAAEQLDDFWVFDTQSNAWDSIPAPFPGGWRTGAVGFAAEGKVYVGTGENGKDCYGDFYEFTPESNTWRKVESMNVNPRSNARVISIGGEHYFGFGKGSKEYRDFWKFVSESQTWERQEPFYEEDFPGMPEAPIVFSINQGGEDYAYAYEYDSDLCFVFRAKEGRWHALEENPFKGMYCFTLDNRLYGMKSYQTYEFKKE